MFQIIQWIKIAYRNILKSKRRTFVTLMAIGFGFAAIALFQGYIHGVYEGLRASAIHASGIGHLTIYKKGWEKFGKSDPEKYMLSSDSVLKIVQIANQNKQVLLASPRLSISGLVSNGRNSTIFLAKGVIPEHEKQIKGAFAAFQPVSGKTINSNLDYGVEMASGLADHLKLMPGSSAVVMGTTLDGQMNAMDIQISGTYNTGVAETNDKFIKVPLLFAQSLYDTQNADSIVLLLDSWKNTETVKQQISTDLENAGIDFEIKTWKELSVFYKSVRNMFDMIFLFIFIIVFVIVIMSTTNTMGMAVIERTREIGTLRALGLKRKGVSALFAAEGLLLGLTGSLAGIFIHTTVWGVIKTLSPTYTPPGNSSPVPLLVDFLPKDLLVMFAFMTVLSLISAIVPARRAAKQNVVKALTHV